MLLNSNHFFLIKIFYFVQTKRTDTSSCRRLLLQEAPPERHRASDIINVLIGSDPECCGYKLGRYLTFRLTVHFWWNHLLTLFNVEDKCSACCWSVHTHRYTHPRLGGLIRLVFSICYSLTGTCIKPSQTLRQAEHHMMFMLGWGSNSLVCLGMSSTIIKDCRNFHPGCAIVSFICL